jgi:hypothetical protein
MQPWPRVSQCVRFPEAAGAFAGIDPMLPTPRRTVLPKLWLLPFAALVGLVGDCAGGIDSAHFGPPAAIERAITRHYERYAGEGNCFNPYIDGFTRRTVLEDTPDQLVVHVRYFYRDRFQEGGGGRGGQICAGFGERTFTLARDADGGPVVIAMTGEQDEPAIRSLIRRVLPN